MSGAPFTPRIIASMHVNAAMLAAVMRSARHSPKTGTMPDNPGTIELRIVQVGAGASAGSPGGLPYLQAETMQGRDALGSPVWGPSTLPPEIVAAVLGRALIESLESEGMRIRTNGTLGPAPGGS